MSNSGTIDATFGGRTLTIDTADDSGNRPREPIRQPEAERTASSWCTAMSTTPAARSSHPAGFVDFELGVTGGGTGTVTISGGGGIEYGWSSDVGTAFDGSGTLALDH